MPWQIHEGVMIRISFRTGAIAAVLLLAAGTAAAQTVRRVSPERLTGYWFLTNKTIDADVPNNRDRAGGDAGRAARASPCRCPIARPPACAGTAPDGGDNLPARADHPAGRRRPRWHRRRPRPLPLIRRTAASIRSRRPAARSSRPAAARGQPGEAAQHRAAGRAAARPVRPSRRQRPAGRERPSQCVDAVAQPGHAWSTGFDATAGNRPVQTVPTVPAATSSRPHSPIPTGSTAPAATSSQRPCGADGRSATEAAGRCNPVPTAPSRYQQPAASNGSDGPPPQPLPAARRLQRFRRPQPLPASPAAFNGSDGPSRFQQPAAASGSNGFDGAGRYTRPAATEQPASAGFDNASRYEQPAAAPRSAPPAAPQAPATMAMPLPGRPVSASPVNKPSPCRPRRRASPRSPRSARRCRRPRPASRSGRR